MKPSDFLPKTWREVLDSGAVTAKTREVLLERISHDAVSLPGFFSEEHFITLKAVCARLIPQVPDEGIVDLPGLLDERLSSPGGKGWRYDALPSDGELFPLGMEGIGRSANALFGAPFHYIAAEQQDEVLIQIQHGHAPGSIWQRIPSRLFFTELLAVLTELYYSHPIAKEQIGDYSFADARGWHFIGLSEQRDYREL